MGYIYCNPNPVRKTAGDCVVRALAIIEDLSWDDAYWELAMQGAMEHTMPSENLVLNSYLENQGYHKGLLPPSCPHCYTVRDFANDHRKGMYLLGTGTHVVTVINGDYYDSWDSGDEIPIYYWTKERGIT